jgi:hypothetical protein
MIFDEDDLDCIRELLSAFACGYERETYDFDCCEANVIIRKIDDYKKIKPLSLTDIQYIRGLIYADKLTHNYEVEGSNAKIDQKTTMHEFTEQLLNKID